MQWCRDNLRLIRSPAEIETLARTVADNGGCYIVPAFSGLFAPYWRPQAQGSADRPDRRTSPTAHIARAVLEATAWQTRDVVDAMNADAGVPPPRLVVDGGMTSDNLLMQLVADVLDIPVVRPMMAETVALGAAYSAGLAQGYWPDRRALRRNWHRAAEWQPQADPPGGTRTRAVAHARSRWRSPGATRTQTSRCRTSSDRRIGHGHGASPAAA